MNEMISDIAFTPAVKAQQFRLGSRDGYARMEQKGGWTDRVTEDLAGFIAARDSFYLATASADGQPCIQHRGGEPGFLKVLDDKTLAFPEYAGNRQYITMGNLAENNQAYLFLMDYPNRYRIKIWGRARVVEDDAELFKRLSGGDGDPVPERAIVFEVTAWDRNCPQFITPRYSEAELTEVTEPLTERIARLEAELAALRGDGHAEAV
jgi:predicted pyridoxine 5'-phosphate oxidase superfamily flavin-nucleotide-binding protein